MLEPLAPYMPALGNGALFILGFFVLTLWIVSIIIKDSSIVDIFWGLGCAAVAWVAWLTAGAGTTRSIVTTIRRCATLFMPARRCIGPTKSMR